MAFCASGNYQLLSQTYKYNEHRIVCNFKVLPAPVTLFDRKATKDYHWMDAGRWRAIETALWRQFEKLANWEDAKRLRLNLMIDYINVRIRVGETRHSATGSLLAGDELVPEEDLCLNIQLEYITSEDTVILHSRATDAETNGIAAKTGSSESKAAGAALQPKSVIPENSMQLEPIYVQDSEEEAEDDYALLFSTVLGNQSTPTGMNRELLTISVDSESSTEDASLYTTISGIETAYSSDQTSIENQESPEESEEEEPLAGSPVETEEEGRRSSTASPFEPTQVRADVPEQVEVLLLESMSLGDVMATYDGYKSHFDKLFSEIRGDRLTLGYMNISLVDVLDILDADIRNKMMNKLAESYLARNNHPSLIINGLLPLWIVLLFIDTYNLSHWEAVRQIKLQTRWTVYLNSMASNSVENEL
ncbi:hypothetical protein KR038_009448 [Drosophila bunnanda]|nr:hypothetical protein KR038_009448 [Drosophila bunnanda]